MTPKLLEDAERKMREAGRLPNTRRISHLARAAIAVALEAAAGEIDRQIAFELTLDGVPREQIQLVVAGMKQLKRSVLALIPKEPT